MIYLDNAATTFPKPDSVYEAMDRFGRTLAGNPGRGGHRFSQASEGAIRDARRGVARLLGAGDPDRVVFTLNATDALNMAIKGLLRPGDDAITTDIEHNSVSRPLEGLAARGVITLTRVRSDRAGRVDPVRVREAMRPTTRLVAVCHASNVLGTVQDVAAMAEIAHAHGARIVIDAAQSAGALPIDLEAMGIDLCAFTGHKALLGPMGTGGLIVREGVEVAAWREGGTGGDSSSPVQPAEYPHHLEGGTPNALGIAGLAAGIDYLARRGMDAILRHERAMALRLAEALRGLPRVRLLAAPSDAGSGDAASGPLVRADTGLVAFRIDGYSPQEAAGILDQSFGIAVRAGLHCAPYIHRRWDHFPDGSVRATTGPFTTEDEIDSAAEAIRSIVEA
jgi:cysteine desulfurase/selenocysteine lyase